MPRMGIEMDTDFPEFFLNLISQINKIENRKTRYGFYLQNSAADSQCEVTRISTMGQQRNLQSNTILRSPDFTFLPRKWKAARI